MSTHHEPTPPARREEDFPKTTTIPEGWVTDAIMEAYNSTGVVQERGANPITVPANGHVNGKNGKVNGKANTETAQAAVSEPQVESPFARRLEPFPSTWDLTGIYL